MKANEKDEADRKRRGRTDSNFRSQKGLENSGNQEDFWFEDGGIDSWHFPSLF